MCLNRMWLAEKLQESWIYSTNSSSSEAHSDGANCNTQRGNTRVNHRIRADLFLITFQ